MSIYLCRARSLLLLAGFLPQVVRRERSAGECFTRSSAWKVPPGSCRVQQGSVGAAAIAGDEAADRTGAYVYVGTFLGRILVYNSRLNPNPFGGTVCDSSNPTAPAYFKL